MTLLQEIRKKWKPRKQTSHKGDFGRVFIVAGSQGLTGAAHLASVAALRSGAGLVTLGVPEKIYSILARREAEVMVKPFPSNSDGAFSKKALSSIFEFSSNQDVLAMGPGLSQNPETQFVIRKLIAKTNLPLVLDADALNALKGNLSILKECKARAILTPHPGEFVRVFGGTLSAEDTLRKKRARAIAKRFGVVMILKGHHTVVADPSGKIYINKTGNPGMAKAGSGDALTGILAALLGQGFSLWDAARFGVFIHGYAGDHAAKKTGQISLISSDLIEALPSVLKRILKH
jgi:ADP-dependent NAD(P)H-hydrate dehydratase / NAD(P)H-hydrate epimerase